MSSTDYSSFKDPDGVAKLMAELAAQRNSLKTLYAKVESVETTVKRSILTTQQSTASLDNKLKQAADIVDAALSSFGDDDDDDKNNNAKTSTPPIPPSTSFMPLPLPTATSDANTNPSQVCIAMLIRDPPIQSLHVFLKYHFSIGIKHIYLYFDDITNENVDVEAMNVANSYSNVTTVLCNEHWYRNLIHSSSSKCWSTYGEYLETDLIARQVLAVEQAILQSHKDEMDWLLHIDIDELLHFPHNIQTKVDQYFSNIPKHIDCIRFLNLEAAPETMELKQIESNDYFQELTLFKKNPSVAMNNATYRKHWPKNKNIFNAYQNGKTAVRIHLDVLPLGSHKFQCNNDDRTLLSVDATGAEVLHYPNASFTLWYRKYKLLGHFPNEWCGTTTKISGTIPKGCFHLESRGVVCGGGGGGGGEVNMDVSKELYRQHVVFDQEKEIQELLRVGLLVRNVEIQMYLKHLLTSSKS